MKLIEQLGEKESLAAFVVNGFGGYEKAKAVLNSPGSAFLHNTEALKQRLLEYRRENNIYEVRDKVVYPNLLHRSLFSVRYINDGEIVVYELCGEMGAKTFTEFYPFSEIRHATDKEIKQGYRDDN